MLVYIHVGGFVTINESDFTISIPIGVVIFIYELHTSHLYFFRNSGNKDTNYMLAILDSRMKIVAHERFQYVLLKKFGELFY